MKQLYIDSDNYLRNLMNDANDRGYVTSFKNRVHPAFDADSIQHIRIEKDGISVYVELDIIPSFYITHHKWIVYTLVKCNQWHLAKTPYDQPFTIDNIIEIMNPQLNDCPICGHVARFETLEQSDGFRFDMKVGCTDSECGLNITRDIGDGTGKLYIQHDWNTLSHVRWVAHKE